MPYQDTFVELGPNSINQLQVKTLTSFHKYSVGHQHNVLSRDTTGMTCMHKQTASHLRGCRRAILAKHASAIERLLLGITQPRNCTGSRPAVTAAVREDVVPSNVLHQNGPNPCSPAQYKRCYVVKESISQSWAGVNTVLHLG